MRMIVALMIGWFCIALPSAADDGKDNCGQQANARGLKGKPRSEFMKQCTHARKDDRKGSDKQAASDRSKESEQERAREAEQKAAEAERKAREAERKAAEAEQRAKEAEQKAKTAEQKAKTSTKTVQTKPFGTKRVVQPQTTDKTVGQQRN